MMPLKHSLTSMIVVEDGKMAMFITPMTRCMVITFQTPST